MATSFTKSVVTSVDSDGNDVSETFNYSATLDGSTATIHRVVDGESTLIRTQPWLCNSDGTRSAWADEAAVVAWFKSEPSQ